MSGHGAADNFFRNLHQQLVQLSAQTDFKGNIMLTISAVLIGLVTPQVIVDGQVRWGAIVFLGFDTAVLLAAVPRSLAPVGPGPSGMVTDTSAPTPAWRAPRPPGGWAAPSCPPCCG